MCEAGYYPACPDFNYGRAHVVNATHLVWQQMSVLRPGLVTNGSLVRNSTVSLPPHVMDEVTIVQHRHGPFPG